MLGVVPSRPVGNKPDIGVVGCVAKGVGVDAGGALAVNRRPWCT